MYVVILALLTELTCQLSQQPNQNPVQNKNMSICFSFGCLLLFFYRSDLSELITLAVS